MKAIIISLCCLILSANNLAAQIKKEMKVKVGTITMPKTTSKREIKKHLDLKITSHAEGANACGPIQILGTGEPGLEITVSLYAYAKVEGKSASPWSVFKRSVTSFGNPIAIAQEVSRSTKSKIDQRLYENYKVTIDKNGKWYIPVFQSLGKIEWIRALWMPFAWTVTAVATDPNYRKGNYTSINIGCGN